MVLVTELLALWAAAQHLYSKIMHWINGTHKRMDPSLSYVSCYLLYSFWLLQLTRFLPLAAIERFHSCRRRWLLAMVLHHHFRPASSRYFLRSRIFYVTCTGTVVGGFEGPASDLRSSVRASWAGCWACAIACLINRVAADLSTSVRPVKNSRTLLNIHCKQS